jgi:hypothetical protein
MFRCSERRFADQEGICLFTIRLPASLALSSLRYATTVREAASAVSFRAEDYFKSKRGFIRAPARRKRRLTKWKTDPRMASAKMAGDRVDARGGLRSRNRAAGT